ncbi:Rieske 2Fe-2S domain-containing protein [Pseudonocardia hispaniensis]|uniref:Rieske 2Fe-2S domain-containing protein n=1 Tax=Pseudonocardia hispaniensis TaxID=904933 RepID=A0ABW1IZH7_9PSEU
MTTLSEAAWERLCAADDVWEGEMSFHRLPDGTAVILVNTAGRLRAFQGICPHQDNTLEDADFDGEIITCPAHMWEFDACSGAGINPTNARLTEYPTEVRDGELFVRVPRSHPRKASQT